MPWTVADAASIRVPPGALIKGNGLYEAVQAVPGAQPWHDNGETVLVPATAAWFVERLLREHGIPCEVRLPHHVQAQIRAPDPSEAVDAARAGGVFPEVFGGFIKPFQVDCLAFGHRRERAAVVVEPGGGKTLVAICWGCAGKPVCPVLLYVTIAPCVTQAADEWKRFADVEVIDLVAPSKRRKRDPSPGDLIEQARETGRLAVLTVGWEVLRDTYQEILDAIGLVPFAAVFDETQRAKSTRRHKWTMDDKGGVRGEAETNTSAVAATVARAAVRVLTTTATPIPNDILDLWAQMDLVEPGGWGLTVRRFRERYCRTEANPYAPHAPPNVLGLLDTHKPELVGRLGWRMIQVPYDVSHKDLPPKRRELVRVRIADQVKEQGGYNQTLRTLSRAAGSGDKRAAVQSMHAKLARAASRKRSFVVRDLTYRLDVGKGKVLVFTGWRKEAEEIGRRMDKIVARRGGECWVSHGGDTQAQREVVKRDFLAHPGPAVLCGTWHAWGTGLNLDDVDTVAFNCLPVTPEEVAQAEGRADRLSTTRPVTYVYYVAEGTVDEYVADLLSSKLTQVEAMTPGTRLSAMGGIRATLDDVTDDKELLEALLNGITEDALLDGVE